MATVKATSPVEAMAIGSQDFRAFLEAHPRVAVGMLEAIVERLREVQDRVAREHAGTGSGEPS